MALVSCRECKAQISSSAKTCPQCGAKAKKHSVVAGIFGGLFLFALLFVLFAKPGPKPEPAPLTAEQQAALDKERTERDENFMFVRGLRDLMKSPDSFKLLKAVRGDDGFCVQFSAMNAMGVTITEAVRVSPPGKSSPVTTCDGMRGKDVTSAVTVDLKHIR